MALRRTNGPRGGHERRLALQKDDVPEADRWNHNIHYHQLLLDAVPTDARRVLDVGCGEGMLVRQFAERGGAVVGVDPDEPGIELAIASTHTTNVDYVLGDVMTFPFEPGSFDAVVSVATLHHLDERAALRRFAELVRPGGTVAVVAIARRTYPADALRDIAGFITSRVLWLRRGRWEHSSPIVWPPPHTYRELRAIAEEELPGCVYRRHVLWRCSILWTKPGP